MSKAIWEVQPRHPKADALARTLGLPPLVGQIVANRGIEDQQSYDTFVNASLKGLLDPMSIHNMQKAASRISHAIRKKERITVYGDYDVDGISGTVTLVLALRMLGADVTWFIPHRTEDGYGLQIPALTEILDGGTQLVISVDCGVTGVEAAAYVKSRGVDLIITDHHEWKDTLPDCYTIVHARLHGWAGDVDAKKPPYKNPDLCGSGVAYKVAWATIRTFHGYGGKLPESNVTFLKEAIAFTALGTIADVVSLTGENRVIAQLGMKACNATSFIGLKALIASANVDGKAIDGYGIGFSLGPRINAAGRMGYAKVAAEMLLETDYTVALATAERLEVQNKERQAEERRIVKEAESQVEDMQAAGIPTDIIIVTGPEWHAGVVGIVASRLSEKFNRPSIVLRGHGGSGRSVEGFSVIDALKSCEHMLSRFGGHAAACGLHLKDDVTVEQFRTAMCDYAKQHLTPKMKQARVVIESEATLADMTESTANLIDKIGPYGNGNRRPFFVFKNVKVIEARRMGKENQFVSFVGQMGPDSVKFVTFKPNQCALDLVAGSVVDVVGEPSINVWQSRTTVQVMIRDIREAGEADPVEEKLF